MDKFQTELLAQLKEHNRLTKELVKIEQAKLDIELVRERRTSNMVPSIANNHIDPLGTYCSVDASVIDIHANRSISDFLPDEIEKENQPTLIRFNIDIDELANYVIQSLIHDEQFRDIFFTRVSNTPTFEGNLLKDAIRINMKEYVNNKYLKEENHA